MYNHTSRRPGGPDVERPRFQNRQRKQGQLNCSCNGMGNVQPKEVTSLCARGHFAQGLRVWIWPMAGTARQRYRGVDVRTLSPGAKGPEAQIKAK
jgi:hypothetical protein